MNEGPALSRAALASVVISTGFVVLNTSMTNIVLPDIGADFDVGAADLSWVVTSLLIPFAAGAVIYGRLADIVGIKRVYLFGQTLFAIASLLVALAPSFGLLIAARVVQGAGASSVAAMGVAVILRTLPPARRGIAMGAISLAVGFGLGMGPILGGTLAEIGRVGWRAVFLLTSFAAFVLVVSSWRQLPPLPGRPGRFDIAGGAFVVTALSGMILVLNRLTATPTDLLGLCGLTLFLISVPLLWWRVQHANEPVIAPALLREPRFLSGSFTGYASQGAAAGMLFLLPLLLVRVNGLSTLRVGLAMLPGALGMAAGGLIGGMLVQRRGLHYLRPLIVVGAALQLAAMLTFHLAATGWEVWEIALVYLLAAAGFGLVNSSISNSATLLLPMRLMGVGSGVYNLCFFLGAASSVAVVGVIVRQQSGATAAWNPLVRGGPPAFADAAMLLAGFSIVAFLLALFTIKPASQSEVAARQTAETNAALAASGDGAAVERAL